MGIFLTLGSGSSNFHYHCHCSCFASCILFVNTIQVDIDIGEIRNVYGKVDNHPLSTNCPSVSTNCPPMSNQVLKTMALTAGSRWSADINWVLNSAFCLLSLSRSHLGLPWFYFLLTRKYFRTLFPEEDRPPSTIAMPRILYGVLFSETCKTIISVWCCCWLMAKLLQN